MRWKGSADFLVIRADRPPAESWRTLLNAREALVVLEMPIPDADLTSMHDWARRQPNYRSLAVLPTSNYYVRKRNSLLAQADPYADVTDRSLWEMLAMTTEAANPVVWPDLQVFYPHRRAPATPAGEFDDAVVAIVSKPAGVLFPAVGSPTLDLGLTLQDINAPRDLIALAASTPWPAKTTTLKRLSNKAWLGLGLGLGRLRSSAVASRTGSEPAIPDKSAHDEPFDYTLRASFPASLVVAEVAELNVVLEWGYEDGSADRTLVSLFPDGNVAAKVSVSANLQLVSGGSQASAVLPVPKDRDSGPSTASFAIRSLAGGPAWIRVRLYREDSHAQVGFLALHRSVAEAASEMPAGAVTTETGVHGASEFEEPDLTLIIEESRMGDRTHVDFRITAGPNYPDPTYLAHPVGVKDFEVSPAALFARRFAEFEKKPANTPAEIAGANLVLEDIGRTLYPDLLPLELRSELEHNGSNIKNICIHAEGDHIPWEMILMPPGLYRGEQRGAEFLAQRYEVTRWMDGYRPPASITLREVKLVVPRYPPGSELRCAADESAFLSGLAAMAVTPVPAKLVNVLKLLAAGGFDVFHFLGHGQQPEADLPRSALELEPADDPPSDPGSEVPPYRPDYLKPESCRLRAEQWKQRRPLIFLNACQSGRRDVGLLQPDGWARAALGSKAGAFVGTLWSIRDETAFKFAKIFYGSLLDQRTFGESALIARRAFTAQDDPSWLAYVVYAHPNTKAVCGR